jgi:hypothetical protein
MINKNLKNFNYKILFINFILVKKNNFYKKFKTLKLLKRKIHGSFEKGHF